MRELEAEPHLGVLYRNAQRILNRSAQPLFMELDVEVVRLRESSLSSNSAARLCAAFDEARWHGREFPAALAEHQARWIVGCLATQTDWQDLRPTFACCAVEVQTELANRNRARFLGERTGTLVTKSRKLEQAEILLSSVPIKR
jgi:hypothetical protein